VPVWSGCHRRLVHAGDDTDADFIPINAFIRIQMEFLEMPGLKLTLEQIARLCGLSRDVSEAVLDRLTRRGFLRRTHDGTFIRP
jgi:hypothetical protein